MSDRLESLHAVSRELEDAATRLRSGELTPDQAATLVDECARLAALAGSELDRLALDTGPDSRPGQDKLL